MILTEKLADLKQQIMKIMVDKRDLGNGYFYIHSSTGHEEFFPIPSMLNMSDHRCKAMVSPALQRLISNYPHVDIIAICTEAWVSLYKPNSTGKSLVRPSEDPNRIEVIQIAGIDTTGTVKSCICPFSRNGNLFAFIDMEPFNKQDSMEIESIFFDGIFGYKYNDRGFKTRR